MQIFEQKNLKFSDAVCSTGNIIGSVTCQQGGQCLQRGSGSLEAYCVCPVGTTGVDCAGTNVPLASAATFPSMFGRPPFISQPTSFNIQPAQRYSRFFNVGASVPGGTRRRLTAQAQRRRPISYRSSTASAKKEDKDEDLP